MAPLNFDISCLAPVSDPWGPSATTPESLKFNGVPYAPFIKSDKLGKIADWQSTKEDENLSYAGNNSKYAQNKRDAYHAYGASAAKMFGAEAEEKGFSLVDKSSALANTANKQAVLKGGRKRQPGAAPGAKKTAASVLASAKKAPVASSATSGAGAKKQGGAGKSSPAWGTNKWAGSGSKWNLPANSNNTGSIEIGEGWKSVADLEFHRLTKLNLEISKPELLQRCGKIHAYSKTYEEKNADFLKPSIKTTVQQTTSQDPNIKQYAADDAAKVFITDEILSQLMCAPKSSASWDIVVTKKNGKVYFDKRENTFSIPLNENSPYTDASKRTAYELEATQISDYYINGSLSETNTSSFEGNSPISASGAIKKGYAYNKFELPNDKEGSNVPVIVRSSMDAYTFTKTSPIAIHPLFQFESNDWRLGFRNNKQGTILSDQIKKNNNKVSQWAIQASLASATQMKLAFIERDNVKVAKNHYVAGVITLTTNMLREQLGLNLNNGWGIVKSFIDIIEHEGGEEDYRFVIFKTPEHPKIVIYKVPFDAFTF